MRRHALPAMAGVGAACLGRVICWALASAAAGAVFGVLYGAMLAALHAEAASIARAAVDVALCGAAAGALGGAFTTVIGCYGFWQDDGGDPGRTPGPSAPVPPVLRVRGRRGLAAQKRAAPGEPSSN